MNYYDARQRKGDSKFDYTCMNDGHIWPVGYCAGFPSPTANGDSHLAELLTKELERLAPLKDRFHTNGHATKEEACACYRRYLLDTRTRFFSEENTQRKCEAFTDPSHTTKCGRWTQGVVYVEDWFACLCEQHRTAEVVASLFPEVGTSWSS